MISALLTIVATLISALATALLIFQGRSNILPGKIAIAVAMFTLAWFLFRSFRHPFIRKSPRASLGLLLSAIVGAYALVLVALFSLQDKLLFFPTRGTFANCETLQSLGFRAVAEKVGNENVRLYWHEAAGARASILIFHGNAESACYGFVYSERIKDLPLNVGLVEYPGYQDDTATPSQAAFTAGADAAYDWLKGQAPKLPVFVLGRSIGSGVATFVASERPTAGLILISPYTSIADVAAYQYPFLPTRLLLRNPFPASEWARKVSAPVLALHGTADRTIPFAIGQAESRNFPNLEQFVEMPGVDHNSILGESREITWKAIRAFIIKTSSPPFG